MKKKVNRQRKLRKCERGIKTRSFNRGFKYRLTQHGVLVPFL